MADEFNDKVGMVRGEIRVRFNGCIQKPAFLSEGAAQAFLDGLKNGTRKPEPVEAFIGEIDDAHRRRIAPRE